MFRINIKQLFLVSFIFLGSNISSNELIFELNSCRFQQETLNIRADTRTNVVNITNITSPGEEADWVSLFNPFQIIEKNGNIIKASSYFSQVMENGGITSGDAYNGSKEIFLELLINLDAKSIFTSIKLSDKAGNDWQTVQNVKLVLKEFGFENAKISNGAMVDGFLYGNCSSEIIKNYQDEDKKRENERILAELQRERLELEKLKLLAEIENNKNAVEADVKREPISSGTGFIINEEGFIATNYHVVHGCEEIKSNDELLKLIITDPTNDLAILTSNRKSKFFITLAEDTAIKGEDIYVLGYPFGKGMSAMSKTTKGIISSLQGLNNSYNQFQMDAPIQPGNSGGPIVNSNGHLRGIAVSSIDMQVLFEEYGALPQNINFGIKVDILKNILDANEINYSVGTNSFWDYLALNSQTEILNKVDKSTLYLECWARPGLELEESLNSARLLKSK